MGDFIPASVGFGFNFNDFSDLTADQQAKVLCLVSRISEASFRRGFQHGHYMHGQGQGRTTVRPDLLRFDAPVDDSPEPDKLGTPGTTTALERLWQNNSVLRDLGFAENRP